MKDILNACKRLGITYNEKLDKIAEIRNTLDTAEREREWLYENGDGTAGYDHVIWRLRTALKAALSELED